MSIQAKVGRWNGGDGNELVVVGCCCWSSMFFCAIRRALPFAEVTEERAFVWIICVCST